MHFTLDNVKQNKKKGEKNHLGSKDGDQKPVCSLVPTINLVPYSMGTALLFW